MCLPLRPWWWSIGIDMVLKSEKWVNVCPSSLPCGQWLRFLGSHGWIGAKRVFSTWCISGLKRNPFRKVNQMWRRGEETSISFSHEAKLIVEISTLTKLFFTEEQCTSHSQKHLPFWTILFLTFMHLQHSYFVLLLNQLEQAKEKWAP